ncbi:putative pentatricopeptide repeat-containing protein At3g23330 [Cryptomeria japonica]|uniref:putative pentatricopeptide repeat-containing protein At3g23330 n=1 Tax=Cryptomeria japonica TaxID=3369 RepID=UPI0027DA2CCA|nr:putative pentatricopeptide repeat-containing protein At3g23330 [Cryptomeria japonica]XP_057843542.2 putative pentatricopeptide repeat-containing protein At3g23330 [Cryptomeria japonica]XP_057843543.2 putative pentatricopeptide repeat-containing protein At3g23330 [Cryptomeria japonica]
MSSIDHLNQNLRAFCREGRLKEALHILLSTPNASVDCSTYLQLLQSCIAKKALSEGKQIHSHINDKGFIFSTNTLLQNKLLNMYDKCGRLVYARNVFEHMREPNIFSWNMIIAAYRKHELSQMAMALFHRMQLTPVQPDHFTFSSVIPICAHFGSLKHGLQIHGKIIRCGYQSEIFVMNTLIDMYAKCRNLHKARELFNKMHDTDMVSWNAMITGCVQNGVLDGAVTLFKEMSQRNVVSWTAIIAGYAQNGVVEKAIEFFKQMVLAGVKPNSLTFASILPGCAKIGALEQGMEIHQKVIESVSLSDVVVTALIDMYAKCGSMQKAHTLFHELPQRDVVSWTAIIGGYAQNGLVDEALKFFKKMQLVDVRPNSSTFASILPACAKFGVFEQGMEIHQKTTEHGFLSDSVIVTALVDMYAKCGRIRKARQLFDKTHHPNVSAWNAMIAGYAMHGYSNNALKLFELMNNSGTSPDHVSFICILFACSHAGLVDDACKCFNCMADSYCTMPTMDHYICMVDLLGRARYIEEALNFIIKMPIKPDVIVWMCLLGACRSHKNIELEEFVSTLLFELDPKNASPYVLLSNTYAEVGRWDDVQRIRKFMKESGIRKTTGCSWIEVHKMIHVFSVGDRSHPQTRMIYLRLEKLYLEMKAVGYIPDTRSVLNDVEEEEKEALICHHSEKLAIAFGLLNTPPGTTIRVVKNLRVCSDCHTATKYISKIIDREIVVRDAQRFHHFKRGQCSCGDYW